MQQPYYPIGRIINLGSSSEGNSFYIEMKRKEYNKTFNLLIECGFDYHTLVTKLANHGISINDIDAVLITHEHLDHSKSIKELVGLGKKVYTSKEVLKRHDISVFNSNVNIMSSYVEKSLCDRISVFGIPLEHVSDGDVPCFNLGYIITIENSFRIAFFTDTKYIKQNLSKFQFNLIFIEANNKRAIIEFGIKNARENGQTQKLIHYKRVLESHMLVEHTAKTLATFDLSKTYHIFLIHLTTDTKKNEREFIDVVKRKLIESDKNVPNIKVADRRGNFI